MSLTEFNEEEFARNRLKEGKAIGVAEGEAKFGRLAVILLKEGSIDLLKRVCVDAQDRKKQYERFGIN